MGTVVNSTCNSINGDPPLEFTPTVPLRRGGQRGDNGLYIKGRDMFYKSEATCRLGILITCSKQYFRLGALCFRSLTVFNILIHRTKDSWLDKRGWNLNYKLFFTIAPPPPPPCLPWRGVVMIFDDLRVEMKTWTSKKGNFSIIQQINPKIYK